MDALIAVLDIELTERQEREVRLRHLERDRDHTHGARPRFAMLALLMLVSAAVSLLGWYYPQWASIGHLVVNALILNVVIWVGLAVWHRQLLASQQGRAVTASTAVIGLVLLCNRLVALHIATPVSHVLMVEMSMMSACLALGGLLVQEWRRPGLAAAATNAAGVVLTVARPDLAVPVASWCAILSLGVLSYTAYQHATHARRE
jgi:hypothetical protein